MEGEQSRSTITFRLGERQRHRAEASAYLQHQLPAPQRSARAGGAACSGPGVAAHFSIPKTSLGSCPALERWPERAERSQCLSQHPQHSSRAGGAVGSQCQPQRPWGSGSLPHTRSTPFSSHLVPTGLRPCCSPRQQPPPAAFPPPPSALPYPRPGSGRFPGRCGVLRLLALGRAACLRTAFPCLRRSPLLAFLPVPRPLSPPRCCRSEQWSAQPLPAPPEVPPSTCLACLPFSSPGASSSLLSAVAAASKHMSQNFCLQSLLPLPRQVQRSRHVRPRPPHPPAEFCQRLQASTYRPFSSFCSLDRQGLWQRSSPVDLLRSCPGPDQRRACRGGSKTGDP